MSTPFGMRASDSAKAEQVCWRNGRFGCTSMGGEALRFRVRVEKFSMRFCGGTFESREFGTGPCMWSLYLELYDRPEKFVVVRLNRSWKFEEREQLVKVKLSVVDASGSLFLTEQKEIFFKENTNAMEVMSLTRGQLHGPLGLKKPDLLPDDALTLACELVACQETVRTFDVKEQFEDSRNSPPVRGVEYFARSSLLRRDFDFYYRFDDLSTLSHRNGELVSAPLRGTDGGEWSLVLYGSDEDNFADVGLRRNHPWGESRFVDAKLSVVGGRLCVPFRKEKKEYFPGDINEQTQLMTIGKRDWLGLKKLLLAPDDSLTVHCKITEYEETQDDAERGHSVPSFLGPLRSFLVSLLVSFLAIANFLYKFVGIAFHYFLAVANFLYKSVGIVLHYFLPITNDYLLPVLKFSGNVVLYVYNKWKNYAEQYERQQNRYNRWQRSQTLRRQRVTQRQWRM